jgi:NIPSNAP protein
MEEFLMTMSPKHLLVYGVGVLAAGVVVGRSIVPATVDAQGNARVFELRTYTAPEGKLPELHKRFRDHTMRIFQKHGMTNIVYLSPQDAPLSQNTLVYLIAHSSREAAKQSWDAFRNDPEWKKVSAESQVNGPIVAKVESMFLDPTDYSPMK